ncbi:NERD domain-containing protein [Photobacterium sagamiensis]|uniref:NERD domain-containing protein n=1 Tax=Photobacterium sagamiensis TaxID=2910241 RepID=UPI003D13D6E7
MSFYAYRSAPFEHTHENKAFNALHDLLQGQWEERDEPLHLLGNFFIDGREVDALVIKRNAIIVIDFKDYSGEVTFSENGRWSADGVLVKGGNNTNPYQQIRSNKFNLLNYLQDHVEFQSRPELGHIAGLCLFHQDILFDETQLPKSVSRWFHVTDMNHVVRTIDAIVSNAIELPQSDIARFISQVDVPLFNPDGIGHVINTINTQNEAKNLEPQVSLTASQKHAFDSAQAWLVEDENSVLSIAGSENSGKKTVLKQICALLLANGKSPIFLSPNARIANKYKALGFSDVQSIYSWLYTSRPSKLEKDKACYDVSLILPDVSREVLVFVDAHLLGDDKFETETTRYGTGYLLQDMLGRLTANGEQIPKMLLVGDPYQLTRGRIQRSLLSGEVFKEKKIEFSTSLLNEQVSLGELSEFQLPLISALSNKTFSRLPEVNGLQVSKIIAGQSTDEIGRSLVEWPKRSVFLCAKNLDAYKVNRGIRRKYLHAKDMSKLVIGDIVDIQNRTSETNDNFEDVTWVNAGSFGQVVAVDSYIEPKTILLKGRKAGTVLHFAKATINFEGVGAVNVRYIPEYLSAETPELTPDQLIALNIWAREEATEKLKNQKQMLDLAKKSLSEAEYQSKKKEYQSQLDHLIISSSYFNAARLRFAYALTVHRAQGYVGWRQVYADASCCHDNANYSTDSYFRWLYTATCCSTAQIGLLKYPTLNPISTASWNLIPKKMSPITVKQRLFVDCDNLLQSDIPAGFDISNELYSKIYLTMSRLVNGSAWYIKDVIQGRPYQQVYDLASTDGSSASIQFSYNKKSEVTVQSVKVNSTTTDSHEISSVIMTPPSYKHELVEAGTDELVNYLDKLGWKAICIEEKSEYKAFVTATKNNTYIKLDLNIDGKGLVSSIKVEQVDSEVVLNQFKEDFNNDD